MKDEIMKEIETKQLSFNELPEEQKIILKHHEKKFYGKCDYK